MTLNIDSPYALAGSTMVHVVYKKNKKKMSQSYQTNKQCPNEISKAHELLKSLKLDVAKHHGFIKNKQTTKPGFSKSMNSGQRQ